ncbi:MAG: hypothetical protein U1D55_14980 [Phycisphaerae bacterium]
MKRDTQQPFDVRSAGFDAAGYDSESSDALGESFLTVEEWKDLVAAYLYELPERLDIRILWSRDGTHFCRVNVWHESVSPGGNRIYRSSFVALDETPDGPRVRDLTRRRAA